MLLIFKFLKLLVQIWSIKVAVVLVTLVGLKIVLELNFETSLVYFAWIRSSMLKSSCSIKLSFQYWSCQLHVWFFFLRNCLYQSYTARRWKYSNFNKNSHNKVFNKCKIRSGLKTIGETEILHLNGDHNY